MSDAPNAIIYPRYCFHLSPTVNTWCLLQATEIHALDQHPGFEGENFYFYKNLPIKWVRIVGVVVAIDENAGRRFYTVDDSSGRTIQALIKLPAPNTEDESKTAEGEIERVSVPKAPQDPGPYPDIDVGAVVDIKGGVGMFRDERQMSIEKMVLLKSTAQELALWEKRARFRREVLDVPWVLRKRDVRRCRKEAERPEAERKIKQLVKTIAKDRMAQRQAKASEKITKSSKLRDSGMSDHLQKIIRDGVATGKYNALGL